MSVVSKGSIRVSVVGDRDKLADPAREHSVEVGRGDPNAAPAIPIFRGQDDYKSVAPRKHVPRFAIGYFTNTFHFGGSVIS
jgi:hypothetical protein